MVLRELKKVLNGINMITDQIRNLYFTNMTTSQIRTWLDVCNFDTNMPIESPNAPNTLEDLKNFLQYHGVVTSLIRKKWFDGYSFGEIRNWLEEHGLDRHMYLELDSTEIAIKDPDYLVMQLRMTETMPDGRKMCGFFGGVTKQGETPLECARRELKEETGIDWDISDENNMIETNTHCHYYDNGDKVLFHTHRYVVEKLISPDELVMDQDEAIEAVKIYQVDETVLTHQRDFANLVLVCGSLAEIKKAIAHRVQ